MIYGGIDWADLSFRICFIDEPGQVVEEFVIRKTGEGFEELLRRARCYPEVLFSMQTGRSPLVDFLLSHGYQI